MKTVTVRLPDALAVDISYESRRRNISKSDVVRERLESSVHERADQHAAISRIADLIGSVDGTPADLNSQRKRYLAKRGDHLEPVMKFMEKYADVPASLAHACLVRMTEMIDNPLLLSTDSDFRHFRRHARSVVPCGLPGR